MWSQAHTQITVDSLPFTTKEQDLYCLSWVVFVRCWCGGNSPPTENTSLRLRDWVVEAVRIQVVEESLKILNLKIEELIEN